MLGAFFALALADLRALIVESPPETTPLARRQGYYTKTLESKLTQTHRNVMLHRTISIPMECYSCNLMHGKAGRDSKLVRGEKRICLETGERS